MTKGPYQIWTPIKNERSFAKERGIATNLPEIGYIEELYDDDWMGNFLSGFMGNGLVRSNK